MPFCGPSPDRIPGPLFPRLDLGERVRAVSNDQALVQAMLAGLRAGVERATLAASFDDPRWELLSAGGLAAAAGSSGCGCAWS